MLKIAGLLLVPNGEDIGRALGDYYPSLERPLNVTDAPSNRSEENSTLVADAEYPHPWSVFFTVLGTVLLDFDADACQSPSRAYLLDVTVPGKRNITLFDKFTVLYAKVHVSLTNMIFTLKRWHVTFN